MTDPLDEQDDVSTFEDFEAALQKPGPWIAGIDFSLGQSRTFIENICWPDTVAAESTSPQKLYGTPVELMSYEAR